jgi:hypothetical protein
VKASHRFIESFTLDIELLCGSFRFNKKNNMMIAGRKNLSAEEEMRKQTMFRERKERGMGRADSAYSVQSSTTQQSQGNGGGHHRVQSGVPSQGHHHHHHHHQQDSVSNHQRHASITSRNDDNNNDTPAPNNGSPPPLIRLATAPAHAVSKPLSLSQNPVAHHPHYHQRAVLHTTSFTPGAPLRSISGDANLNQIDHSQIQLKL